ncbi:Guanine nucleotide exchange factor DBS [Trichuris trichiura]|uniref:Guanine nucleotide exchange factor DBS n=1 Tax=Trichuris trichiura TaxID=36087 RepID=A0A077ZCY4_TRITR|nr:Guanine nucleotide exchange factor DBS [Trichuris trichiura]
MVWSSREAIFNSTPTSQRILRADLEESGYQSALTRSQNSQYGTGWLYHDSESIASTSSCDEWDGYMTIDNERIKIREVSDLLVTRYAFISGAKSEQGLPVLTFPDSHVQFSFADYRILVNYLARLQPVEDIFNGFVAIIDRRTDRWSSVKTVLSYLTLFFPGSLRVAYVLKPDGVLQRALEVFVCNNLLELHRYVHPSRLTVDLGGSFCYNHLEWLQHRMEVERLRCSAEGIARTLDEFVQSLKDTELPNDASTTAHILTSQRFDLLKAVRQVDSKPNADQLSPTRLHNVTSVQRTLLQLEDAEKSFDKFWPDHELRLEHCLRLRQFEEDFKKLQANFLNHLDRLRNSNDGRADEQRLYSIEDTDRLIDEYQSYAKKTEEDFEAANALKLRGEQLIETEEKELIGSITPKCQELNRLTAQLDVALRQRAQFLHSARRLQNYISSANQWCATGVDLLTGASMEFESAEQCEAALQRVRTFLKSGDEMCFDLDTSDSLLLLTSYDTKTLLDQVNARLTDVKQLCQNRCFFLKRLLSKTRSSAQSYSPFTESERIGMTLSGTYVPPSKGMQTSSSSPQASDTSEENALPQSIAGGNLWSDMACFDDDGKSRCSSDSLPKRSAFVINELVTTEQSYVDELSSVMDHYVSAIDDPPTGCHLPSAVQAQRDILFGNLAEIHQFHKVHFLPSLLRSSREGGAKEIANAFLEHGDGLRCYVTYCLNKPKSDALLRRHEQECHTFLKTCQQRAGHGLPLGAYLLKPVQRITKYQLLLKVNFNFLHRRCFKKPSFFLQELARSSSLTEGRTDVELALDAILYLLQQANASLNQGYIVGYTVRQKDNNYAQVAYFFFVQGDLSALGPVLMEGSFRVSLSKRNGEKALRMRRGAKLRYRHVFLYSSLLLMCKHRRNSVPNAEERYEVKEELPVRFHNHFAFASQPSAVVQVYSIEQVETVKGKEGRFQVITENRNETLTFSSSPDKVLQFVSKLKQLIERCNSSFGKSMHFHFRKPSELLFLGSSHHHRPISWTSHSSNETGCIRVGERKRHSETDLLSRSVNGVAGGGATSRYPLARSEHNLLRCFESAIHRSRSMDGQNVNKKEVKEVTISCRLHRCHTARICRDFVAKSRDHLSVVSGEAVIILNKRDKTDWTLVKSLRTQREGWVPAGHVQATVVSLDHFLTLLTFHVATMYVSTVAVEDVLVNNGYVASTAAHAIAAG